MPALAFWATRAGGRIWDLTHPASSMRGDSTVKRKRWGGETGPPNAVSPEGGLFRRKGIGELGGGSNLWGFWRF